MNNDYYDHQRNLPTEDLVKIAYFERRKIKREARHSAKQILIERNVKDEELQDYKNQIGEIKREERKLKLKNKNEKYNIWDFLLDMIFSG